MDQEASWVGLGWNLNPGVINRNMRGLPDDFNGDEITEEFNIKRNTTIGVKSGANIELLGKKFKSKLSETQKKSNKKSVSIGGHTGIYVNSYNGAGIDVGLSFSVAGGIMDKMAPAWGAGLNLNFNSDGGTTIQPSANISLHKDRAKKKISGVGGGLNANTAYNSRTGMRSLNFGYSLTAQRNYYQNGAKSGQSKMGSRRNASESLGGSGSAIIWGVPSYTPHIEFPMTTFSISGDFSYAIPINGFDVHFFANAYYTRQSLKEKRLVRKSFGYQFLENSEEGHVTDLNREHDQPFSELNENLAIPISTYDIFSVSGHGIQGTFRLYRNDVVNFHEDAMETTANDVAIGGEAGALKIAKFGLNTNFTNTRTRSGNWESGNNLQNAVQSVKKSEHPLHPQYEPAFFMQMGEHVGSNWQDNPSIQGTSLISPRINGDQVGGGFLKYLNKSNPTASKTFHPTSDPLANVNTARQPRNMVMYALNADDAYYAGLTPYLKWFIYHATPAAGKLTPTEGAQRSGNYRKGHHISELNVISTDGSRYVYGLPAYNITQVEVTFAVNGGANCQTGYVKYIDGDLNPDVNANGKDNLVQKTTIPAYAYAYHLTGILSPDYVDLRGDGITDDDLGSAVKFNYSSSGVAVKWRIPIAKDSANFIEGLKSDPSDDKGSIMYGEKEVFYVHSIEGKNHIAVFYISERGDATGVQGFEGGNHTGGTFHGQASMRLDSVILYNKQDYLANGDNAYKIKGVHFEYDYSLCGAVPNGVDVFFYGDANKGKLTLKKLYFTYGNSFKGKLSPY
ncbi:MAG: hypothetical protein ACYC1Q_12375, partial [Bacteroidia bacterium]